MTKVEELKKQLLDAEQDEKRAKLEKQLAVLKEEREGKVILTASKWDKRSKYLYITWYKEYKIEHKDYREEKDFIVHSSETIEVMYIKPRNKNDWKISSLNHQSHNFDSVGATTSGYITTPAITRKITVEEFKVLTDYVRVCSQNIIDNIEGLDVLAWVERQGDYDKRRKVEETTFLLDIPHTVLTQEEAWLVSDSVFLNETVFLLTENSMKYLHQIAGKAQEWDNFAQQACASVGERWRNSNMSRLNTLIDKIQREYLKSKK